MLFAHVGIRVSPLVFPSSRVQARPVWQLPVHELTGPVNTEHNIRLICTLSEYMLAVYMQFMYTYYDVLMLCKFLEVYNDYVRKYSSKSTINREIHSFTWRLPF